MRLQRAVPMLAAVAALTAGAAPASAFQPEESGAAPTVISPSATTGSNDTGIEIAAGAGLIAAAALGAGGYAAGRRSARLGRRTGRVVSPRS